jgi:ribosomal protein L19E
MILKDNQKTQTKKGRQYNVQATKGQTDKRTNNDQQNNTPQANDRAMLISLKNGSDLQNNVMASYYNNTVHPVMCKC